LLNFIRLEEQTIVWAADDCEGIGRVRKRDELGNFVGEITERTVRGVGHVRKKIANPFTKTGDRRICNKPDWNSERIVPAGGSIKNVIPDYVRVWIWVPREGNAAVRKGAANHDSEGPHKEETSKRKMSAARVS